MMDEICAHIHNWFTKAEDIHRGTFTIEGGSIDLPFLVPGQYFRIVGSALNDGVYQYPAGSTGEGESGENDEGGEGSEGGGEAQALALTDETFEGEIWAMRIPRAFVLLAGEIGAWDAQYGAAMSSPYQSENIIGVYSYTKAAGANGGGASGAAWQSAYKSRLNQWRKIR